MKLHIKYKTEDGLLHQSSSFDSDDYSIEKIKAGKRTQVFIHPKKPLLLKGARITVGTDYEPGCRFFVNGFQSWTDTREYDYDEDLNNIERLPKALRDRYHFEAYGDAWFHRYKKDELHGYTFAYVKNADGSTDLIGSLNEENAWLIVTYKRKKQVMVLESDVDGRLIKDTFPLFDLVHYKGTTHEVLDEYFRHYGPCEAAPIRGYTSWYLDYQDISEEKMLRTLSSVDSEHFDLFQIDDGFETFVGDWLDIDPVKFPNGLSDIVEKIHDKGLKAGIWLAPFVCETKSRVFNEHPDWVYRKASGQSVFAGNNWSGFCPLDIRKAEVRAYIRQCLAYYKELGFDFFKLDFLYAAALVRSSKWTRAENMRYCVKLLREALGDKLILGCGVPLSSAFELADYCRVGPDVSLSFDDVLYMRFMHRERVSTKITLQNTIYRSAMDGHVFRCDPDVYLLRDDNISLSKEQRKALTYLNHLCGAVYMTSDDVGKYDAEKKEVLEQAQALAGAQITDIRRAGNIVTIYYSLNGEQSALSYDTGKGVLMSF